MKNSLAEVKNIPEGMSSKLSDTEEYISDLEERIKEITKPEQQFKKLKAI